MAHIARAAVQAQRSRGESMGKLAQRSGIEQSRLRRILEGKEDLQIDTVFLLASALEITPATLLQGVEWIPDGRGGGCFEIEHPDQA
jgi:transcriptional regulator with XRE-family HTH domain